MSASLVGRLGSSAFRLSNVAVSMSLAGSRFSSDSALLAAWGSKTRWNNLSVGLAIGLAPGPSGHTNSPHPSSREGHHSTTRWSSSFLSSVIATLSCRCGPTQMRCMITARRRVRRRSSFSCRAASPHRIAPVRSISPDWYLAQVNPNTAPTDLDFRKRTGTSIEYNNRSVRHCF